MKPESECVPQSDDLRGMAPRVQEKSPGKSVTIVSKVHLRGGTAWGTVSQLEWTPMAHLTPNQGRDQVYYATSP